VGAEVGIAVGTAAVGLGVAVCLGRGLAFGLGRLAVGVAVGAGARFGASSRPALTGSDEIPTRCVERELAA
jgi:hypothetical protein